MWIYHVKSSLFVEAIVKYRVFQVQQFLCQMIHKPPIKEYNIWLRLKIHSQSQHEIVSTVMLRA